MHSVGKERKKFSKLFQSLSPKRKENWKDFSGQVKFWNETFYFATEKLRHKEIKQLAEKITTELRTFKSYSVVLTSFWKQVTSVSYFRGHRTISLYSDSSSVCSYNLGLQLRCPAIPRTNAIEISSRSVFQAFLDKTPPGISWQTRLLGKEQKPQLLSNIRKGER